MIARSAVLRTPFTWSTARDLPPSFPSPPPRAMPPAPDARSDLRVPTSRNVVWTPRPGWATIRLVGTCADRSLRRGQVVVHSPSEDEGDLPGGLEELRPGTLVIVLAEAAHLVEDDLNLVPEMAVIAVGEVLP